MSRLRIGWAAPWNEISAIAQSAAEVAFELAERGHSVTVLRTETGACLEHSVRKAPGPIRHLSEYHNHELMLDFDIIVGHFGDHYGFSGALLPRLADVDVVGIMHDACIPHLLDNWNGNNPDTFRTMVRETYGPAGLPDGVPLWGDLAAIARYRPMLEWVAQRLVGAVAHSEHYAPRLRTSCSGPVEVIPLAFSVPELPPSPPPWKKLTVAVVGNVNANKRIDQLIMAASASYLLRAQCRFRIIGDASDRERTRLTTLAQRLGVVAPDFIGWVSNDDLANQLRDVDVMSCLRNPVLEGASASLVLALSSGRPTLITRHGCYAEVPEDVVLSCAPENEALDVMKHLEQFVIDPSVGAATGRRGQEFVKGKHTAAHYVDALLPMLKEIVARRPVTHARHELNQTLAEFGLPATDPAAARIASVLHNMTAVAV